jgi:hypothetical protein
MKKRTGVVSWRDANHSPELNEITNAHFIANGLSEFGARTSSLVKTHQLVVDGIECYGMIRHDTAST